MIPNVPSVYNQPTIYNQAGGGANLDDYIVVQPIDGVEMPDGRIWSTVNLKLIPYGIEQGSVWQKSPPECNAYNQDATLIDEYGLYYNFAAAEFLHTNKDTLFPGWDVPTRAEYEALFSACSNSYITLQAAGFNDKKCGGMVVFDGNWQYKGYHSFYWSRSSQNSDSGWSAYMNASDPLAMSSHWKQSLYPIRLVKDV